MAYYSKYTGAELEEKLDKVEEIPQLIAQMITGKNFVTKEDLLCVLKDYAPADYRTIPIDKNTIYWENGVLKAATSEGGQCQWELREHNGIQYLYSRLPVVTQYDVTMYADVNHLDLPSIYDGLPIDGDTIYWEETEDGKVLKAKSVGGSGESIDAGWVISVISNAGFATQNWVNNQNFITQSYLATELLKYVTLDNYQEIIGVKNFINGLQISNIPIKKLEGYDDILYIDSNVVIRGGLTMYYEDGDIDLPSIKEEIGNAGYDGTTGLASFNSEHFSISSDGIVSIIGGTGGLDIEQLESYLTSNKYVQQSYVDNAVSNINNRLNDFLTGTDTDTIINKWKELELFLEGLTESDNLAEILTSKASLDYVNSTFVTIAGNEDVTGLHNFVNGLKIGGMRLSKSQDDVVYLEGNLVVKGGVTMYALDEVTVDSIIDSLPLASTSQYGIAKFNPSNFVINEDGFVTIIGGSSGLDTEELAEYLATNKYATQGWVEGKGYITSSALNGYATQGWVTNQKYITGITSAMVVSALGFTPYNSANFTKTNIKSTLGISDWALASIKPSYTFSEIGSKPTTLGGYGITDAYTKTQVNNTFALYIPIAGYTNVTGEKNFTGGLKVNGSPIYYDATNKYWKLEGDLLVTGGVTMYGSDDSDFGSIFDEIPIDRDTIYWSNGVLKAKSNSSGGGSIKYPLTFTGAVVATYDGSSPVTVNIPTAGGNVDLSGYLKKSGGAMTGQFSIMAVKSTSGPNIYYTGATGTAFGRIGFAGVDMPYIWKADATGGYDILHAGNYSSYALPLSGGTMKDEAKIAFQGNNSYGSSRWTIFAYGPSFQIKYGSYGSTTTPNGALELANDGKIYNAGKLILTEANYSSYALPLSGGTITHSNDVGLWLQRTSGSGSLISFKNSSNHGGLFGVIQDSQFTGLSAIVSCQGRRLSVLSTGGVYYQENYGTTPYEILHSGNYSSYALPLSGGTLTATSSDTALVLRSGTNASWLAFRDSSNNFLASIGIKNDNQPYVYTNSIGYKIWHAGNDGSGSGLDADLLDGIHASSMFYAKNKGIDGSNINTTLANGVYFTGGYAPVTGAYQYGTLLCFRSGAVDTNSRQTQFYISDGQNATGGIIYYRDAWNSTSNITSGWHRLARVTDNVASATKLQTARTIWGQSFNGTANIDGALYMKNNTYIYFKNASGSNMIGMYASTSGNLIIGAGVASIGNNTYLDGNTIKLRYGTNSTLGFILNDAGNVGIGTTSPSRALHVVGSMITEEGSIEAFQSVNGPGKYAFIKINEYYTHGKEEWASYIVSDYYGTNWCTTGGFTHGMYFKSGRYQFDNFIFLDSQGNPIVRLSSANTGMGHHFMGNALFTGGITMYSDIRKKTKLKDVELSLSQIANAPLIQHYYNSDQNKTTHVGSIAQYWARLNDWFCKLDNEGYYTMEIQNCALASAISIARHLEKYETKTDKTIRKMKKRIQELEDEVERLKNN